ncbi:MAG: TIGR02253 family HAD-type hydrolase [Methanomicrobia archaeon]|nr:TIGR02253 family HAD-type hydrolase [Methanomicrobia archaeon]
MIKSVVFDLDDTLYNSTALSESARKSALKAMVNEGLDIDLKKGYEDLMRIVKRYGSNYSEHFNRFLEEKLGYVDYKFLASGVIAYHNTKFAYIRPFDDTVPTLIKLVKRKKKLGIVTNGVPVKQWEKILRLGLEHFFEFVIISSEVKYEKPSPKIYEIALEKLDLPPEEALMVDNKIEDLKGAKNVGMKTVLIARVKDAEYAPKIKKLSEILNFVD